MFKRKLCYDTVLYKILCQASVQGQKVDILQLNGSACGDYFESLHTRKLYTCMVL